jgi:hypothetical protein
VPHVCLSSRHHLSGRGTGTTTAPGSTAGAATTAPLAETTTAAIAAEVTTSTALALLEVAALAVELLLLLGAGAVGAALLDPELLVADLEGAGGKGVLVALGCLEVDECAALCVKSVKEYHHKLWLVHHTFAR